jgi:hypothetical protein
MKTFQQFKEQIPYVNEGIQLPFLSKKKSPEQQRKENISKLRELQKLDAERRRSRFQSDVAKESFNGSIEKVADDNDPTPGNQGLKKLKKTINKVNQTGDANVN